MPLYSETPHYSIKPIGVSTTGINDDFQEVRVNGRRDVDFRLYGWRRGILHLRIELAAARRGPEEVPHKGTEKEKHSKRTQQRDDGNDEVGGLDGNGMVEEVVEKVDKFGGRTNVGGYHFSEGRGLQRKSRPTMLWDWGRGLPRRGIRDMKSAL